MCCAGREMGVKEKFFQLLSGFAICFGQICMGSLNVWPSYTTSVYSSNGTTPLSESMSTAEECLLGSLPSLGAMLGSAVVGYLINTFGRKNGGILLSLPFVLSWAMVSVTSSMTVVLAARFLGGVAGGASLVFSPIFISEVASDDFRGTLASGPILLYCTGTLVSYVFGWLLSYRAIIWINLVFSVTCILLIMMLQESPVFLIRQKREEEARTSIAFYRNSTKSSMIVMEEFSKLKQQMMPVVELVTVNRESESKITLKIEEAEKEKLNTEAVGTQKKMSAINLLLLSPSSLRAFMTVMAVISIQVFMGIVPVQVYAKTVFMRTDPDNADVYTIIFALVLLGGSLVTTSIADILGRRILLISSSVLVTVWMVILGVLLQTQIAPPWVTVVCIMTYCFSFMFGVGTVPYVLVAESFAPEVQSIASTIIIEWVWFLNFFIIAVFPVMNNLFGTHGCFYFFALMSVANTITSYIFVPETKGLSNEQIQEAYLGRRKL